MALSVTISNDDGKPFLPGSLVLGVVKLVIYDDQNIGELTINFSGCANVRLIHSYGDMTTSRRDYKSVGYLFSQRLSLYQGKYTHRKGSYMWPFAFRIPLYAAPRALPSGSRDFFGPERPWKNDYSVELHPLPPSMSHRGPFICSVEYMLHATLAGPSRGPISLNKTLSAMERVRIQNLPSQKDLDVSGDGLYINYQHNLRCTLDNFPRIIPKLLCSILCEGRRRFKSITPPEVELRMSVWIPKRIILNGQVTLSVLVAMTSRSTGPDNATKRNLSNDHVQPTNLRIRSFKLSLFQHTRVRTGCHRSSSEKKILVRRGSCILPLSGDSSLEPSQSGNTSQDSRPARFVNLADMADLRVPMAALVPDFSTYNIAGCHSLEVLFNMEYENKRFKCNFGKVPLQVLSQECGTVDQGVIHPMERWANQSISDEVWIRPPPSEDDIDDDNDDDDDVVSAWATETLPPYT
ncbi:uncharacterized protein Z518_05073 [Rhinocladiella mackenziei CBS 650.93]|uniref:Rhinocladiella mackenziei CBS 650.93 unplaced genomic scaffold supercont1.3, whole genome shotgun sequence n=1 Tax=Rhinocladiella mackenziei CBS 650.93 TaxID=1442369 RepID=A0A0D2IV96_9EURO|nr:uncharacterized protein Z518_05073 [Rhinocladiella mackenziei CBS 650.93]KIX07096.1 hypothetical protein Z518_05073 [Rhinocladiella mackenziei CBS 650.93]